MVCSLVGVRRELADGTPSEIVIYTLKNNYTKFGALDRSVMIWHKFGHKQLD